MKKSLKIRLTLNRETLRNLNAEELTAAPGGRNTDTICANVTNSCFQSQCVVCITQNTCPSKCGQYYC
jgi:hypothetical protein